MKLKIHFTCEYRYADEVSFSPHVLRLFPRQDTHVDVEDFQLRMEPKCDPQYRRDLYDNPVASCFFPDTSTRLGIDLELTVRVRAKNPFHFLLESHALEIPFPYRPEEAAALAPFLGPIPVSSLPSPLAPRDARPSVEVLAEMNRWLFENIRYERREQGPARPPEETLAIGHGACRDTAWLLTAALRQAGLAARMASGFLYEPSLPSMERRAESALHAWTEVYLPGAGWIGMDPTNGVFCDHHFLTAAVGRTPADVMPIHGSYYAPGTVESHMTSQLEIREI